MKKLLAAMSFGAGAVFGMFFSDKKGSSVRRKVSEKRSNEEKAEVIGEEAKALFQNFWSTVRKPLQKSMKKAQSEMGKYSAEYSKQAKQKIDQWKAMAEAEIKKDVSKAKKEIQKSAKKAKTSAKKKVSAAKKSVKKKLKK